MSSPASRGSPVFNRSASIVEDLRADGRIVAATVRALLLRQASSPTLVARTAIAPVLGLIGFVITYHVSGQQQIDGENVNGFLITGMLATWAWGATVWGSGNALQAEIYSGTIGAIMAAPARIGAVILGYGIGSLVSGLPGLVGCIVVGVSFGARFDITSIAAALVAVLAVFAATLCIGMGFGGLFILSRQSNALSNFLQGPIWLLAGFYVPRTALPGWVQVVSDVIPLAHGLDALRATMLSGATFAGVWQSLAATAATSGVFLLVGLWSLANLDRAVRRRASLDLQ